MNWYESLNKPSFVPSSEVFSIIWTILYILIALSFCLYYYKIGFDITLVVLCINIACNLIWPIVFFRLKYLLGSFILCLFIQYSALYCVYEFSEKYSLSSLLLIPYVLWAHLASYFSWYIYKHN